MSMAAIGLRLLRELLSVAARSARLVRWEGRVAFQRLLERCPNLQLATDTVQWQPTMTSRALAALPVTL